MVSMLALLEIALLGGLIVAGFLVSVPVGVMAVCASGLYELAGVRR